MRRLVFICTLLAGLMGFAMFADASRRMLLANTVSDSAPPAPWTPASLGTNLLWWSNSSTNNMEFSGSTITRSTNTVDGTNFWVTTGSPTLTTISNRPGIKFGTNAYSDFAPIPISGSVPMTVAFVVCAYTNTGTGTLSTFGRIGDGYPNYLHFGTGGSDNIISIRESATTRASSPNLTLTGGTNRIVITYTGSGNATGVTAYLNGSAGSTFASTVIGAWTADDVNNWNSIGGAQNPRGATYGEVLIVYGVVSAADRTNIFNYLPQ